jgi:hypothetical protein
MVDLKDIGWKTRMLMIALPHHPNSKANYGWSIELGPDKILYFLKFIGLTIGTLFNRLFVFSHFPASKIPNLRR